jgi:F-type H+-transporting ATPase subunit b
MFVAEFWVAVAFVIFVGVLIYFRVHKLAIDALDDRSARIEAARRGAAAAGKRAQALLAQYQRKQRGRTRRPPTSSPAPRPRPPLSGEAKAKMEDFLARRTKMAETKIGPGRGAGARRWGAAAAEAAIAAAEIILKETVRGKVADDLIAKGIKDLGALSS